MFVQLRANMRSKNRAWRTNSYFHQPKKDARHEGVKPKLNKFQRELLKSVYTKMYMLEKVPFLFV